MLDLDHVMVYGLEGSQCPFPCRYYGVQLPQNGVSPTTARSPIRRRHHPSPRLRKLGKTDSALDMRWHAKRWKVKAVLDPGKAKPVEKIGNFHTFPSAHFLAIHQYRKAAASCRTYPVRSRRCTSQF